MSAVYAVTADYNYEGVSVMHAYTTLADAKAFAAECNAYANRGDRPKAPPIEDTPENDALHEQWWAALQDWEAKHPAPEYVSANSFGVREIDVHEVHPKGKD